MERADFPGAEARNSIAAPITSAGSRGRMAVRLSGKTVPLIAAKLHAVLSEDDFRFGCRETVLEISGAFGILRVPAIVLTMPRGRSYTLEPVMEIHFPANETLAGMILSRVFGLGARPAEPGEFTRRAFLNGRISLGQAHAVARLVQAGCEAERRDALSALAGAEGGLAKELKALLFGLRRDLEAVIDFSEEPDAAACAGGWREHLDRIKAFLEERRRSFVPRPAMGRMRLALLGPVNSGKSSLVKSLVVGARPIVSAAAGCTVDLVPYTLEIGPHRAVLYDCPGFREKNPASSLVEGAALVEGLALEALKSRLASFDAFLVLVPPKGWEGSACLGLPAGKAVVEIRSKADLVPRPERVPGGLYVSALDGEGLELLAGRLLELLEEHGASLRCPWSALEKRILDLSAERLPALEELLAEARPREELAAYELDELLEELSGLMHGNGGNELLDSIFRDFCIGK